ncbi:MAG: methyltransferase domain-containing protein [Candidatus Galacturonibacter soehngenii]|nr:methyltransferase domain-containing protein [Candidatus Galacturonibacter soehngenii]
MKEIIDYYSNYDEDGRLFRDYSHNIEWLTTMHYFNTVLPQRCRIFDGCAGTGNYAFELAKRGHSVVASDIVPHNVDMIHKKQQNNLLQDIFIGDICNVDKYDNQYFDVVLCMGAFYHLNEEGRNCAIKECLRILKKEGILVISYINLLAVLFMQLDKRLENIEEILGYYENRNLGDSFIYMLPEDIETMSSDYKLKILHHLTSDGNVYMHNNSFNDASKENFEKYMKLHLKTCENKNILGYGLHGLVFLMKV